MENRLSSPAPAKPTDHNLSHAEILLIMFEVVIRCWCVCVAAFSWKIDLQGWSWVTAIYFHYYLCQPVGMCVSSHYAQEQAMKKWNTPVIGATYQSLSLFDPASVQISIQNIQLRLFTLWLTGKNKLVSFSHSEKDALYMWRCSYWDISHVWQRSGRIFLYASMTPLCYRKKRIINEPNYQITYLPERTGRVRANRCGKYRPPLMQLM